MFHSTLKSSLRNYYTQGLDENFNYNGNFEPIYYSSIEIQDFIAKILELPTPNCETSNEKCPPVIGFQIDKERGNFSVNRQKDGNFFVFPLKKTCTVEEIKEIVKQFW